MSKSNIRSGDTIVEVLLAIAVMAALLAGAFVASNRSLRASQSARERSEAIKIAETQIERLKYLSSSSGSINIYIPGPFCVTSTLTLPGFVDIDPDPAIFSVAPEPTGCSFSSRYAVSITYDSTTKIYQIQVVWSNLSGFNGAAGYQAADQIKMYYRIYQKI